MKRLTEEELIQTLVDRMLERHGKDCAYVLENPIIDGVEWYAYYTWTDGEEQEFKAWAIPLIKKTLGGTIRRAKKEYDWFNLMYGLRIV